MKITTAGLDLAKSMIQVHGMEGRGETIPEKQL